jgi:hypothetical protein
MGRSYYPGGRKVCVERETLRFPTVGISTEIQLQLTAKQARAKEAAQKQLDEGAERTISRREASQIQPKTFLRPVRWTAGEPERVLASSVLPEKERCVDFPARTLQCWQQQYEEHLLKPSTADPDCEYVKYAYQCADATMDRAILSPAIAGGLAQVPKSIAERCVLNVLVPKKVVQETGRTFMKDPTYRTLERLPPPKKG